MLNINSSNKTKSTAKFLNFCTNVQSLIGLFCINIIEIKKEGKLGKTRKNFLASLFTVSANKKTHKKLFKT